ncbi:divalent-cation tolerance protein CutA [Haloplanus salinus]|uniref:Divalent-cation tolerance protein CutA n=1 Tax=Haloplanus salinus TaxID=1126245 RepID=A0A368NEJ6_9EURY|nr:divalent-cation tolerance protein CutA [Haloplanus salinus]RCU48014.1 divalent-cation tolerance protein CutA [Haloplanus salinus]
MVAFVSHHTSDRKAACDPTCKQFQTLLYVTAPRDAATDLARRLVDERLAACVNVADCTSTYRWDGAVHEDAEAILLAKTTDDRYDELATRVVEWHPHAVPCVERIDTVDADAPFAAWCAGAVADAE